MITTIQFVAASRPQARMWKREFRRLGFKPYGDEGLSFLIDTKASPGEIERMVRQARRDGAGLTILAAPRRVDADEVYGDSRGGAASPGPPPHHLAEGGGRNFALSRPVPSRQKGQL